LGDRKKVWCVAIDPQQGTTTKTAAFTSRGGGLHATERETTTKHHGAARQTAGRCSSPSGARPKKKTNKTKRAAQKQLQKS
jgi:hypothetical protein